MEIKRYNTMKIMKLLSLALLLLMVSCGEYYGYDADTAESPYKPIENVRMVKTLKTTNSVDGRDYSWEHNFTYDAQNRIKSINSQIVHHREVTSIDGIKRYYICNVSSTADYYYMGNNIDVRYNIVWEHPGHPDWDLDTNGTDKGVFDNNGLLLKFASMDFEYSFMTLNSVLVDGGYRYDLTRDRNSNMTGYRLYNTNTEKDSLVVDNSNKYRYSARKNNTNFDFSGYFGYWGIERELVPNSTPYYASYHLAAFGMFGTGGSHLPLGESSADYGVWEFDEEGSPLVFVDATGRRTIVSYWE